MDTTPKRTPMAAIEDARQNDFNMPITAEDVKKAKMENKLVAEALATAFEFKRIADQMFADPEFAQSEGGRKLLHHYLSISNKSKVYRKAFGDILVRYFPDIDDKQLHMCYDSQCKLPSCVKASPKGSGQKDATAKKRQRKVTETKTIEVEEGAAEFSSTDKQVAESSGGNSQAGDKMACSTSTIDGNVAQQSLDNNNKTAEALKVDSSSASMQKSPGETSSSSPLSTSGQIGPSAGTAEVFDCRVKDCSLQFNSFEEAVKHYESHENDNIIKCSRCDVMYLSRELMCRHFVDVHNVSSGEVPDSSLTE